MSDSITDTNDVVDEAAADALLDSIEEPSNSPIQDTPQPVDEWNLTVGGKQIKAKREQILQWAQQGYSAPGKISQLSKEIDSWKHKWTEAEPKWKDMESKYGEIDTYVRQNPQFWDHVTQSYQQRQNQFTENSNPLAGTVQSLQAQVHDLIQYKNQIETDRQKTMTAQQDKEYVESVDTMKKAYPDIDFDSPDESGINLEYKILAHARDNGISNFKSAFRDFYHDELVKRSEAKAKEAVIKDKQKSTKLGILGTSSYSAQKPSERNIRNKSYDDLSAEALQELGIR